MTRRMDQEEYNEHIVSWRYVDNADYHGLSLSSRPAVEETLKHFIACDIRFKLAIKGNCKKTV